MIEYRRLAYRWLGDFARWTMEDRPGFWGTLARAGIRERPEMYLAIRYLGMAAILAVTVLALAVELVLGAGLFVTVPTVTLGLVALGAAYGWTWYGPNVIAFMRGEKIHDNLPYAVNYMASIARADVTPERIFENLGRQPVYGEVAVEARQITHDLGVLGADLVEALERAAQRAPSERFQDFLRGAITSIGAGGSFEDYLEVKSEQYMTQFRQEQEGFLDNLGVIAESYVTVIVAGPMFVLILLTVLALFGAQGNLPLRLGYAMMLLIIPLANLGFVVTIETMAPNV